MTEPVPPKGEAIRAGEAKPLDLEQIKARIAAENAQLPAGAYSSRNNELQTLITEVERLRASSGSPDEVRVGPKRCRDCGTLLIWLQSWQGWDCVACNRRELWQFIEQSAASRSLETQPAPPDVWMKVIHAIAVEAMTAQSDPHAEAQHYRKALIGICNMALKAQDSLAASDAPERDTRPADYVFHRFLKEESVAAHLALDKAGIPTTKLVPNRAGDGKQEITMGLAERVRLLASPRASAATTEEEYKTLYFDLLLRVRALSSPSPAPPPDKERP